MKPHILIVEDDYAFSALISEKFSSLDWKISVANSLKDLDGVLNTFFVEPFSHCLMDLNLAGQSSLGQVPVILSTSPFCKIVILTGYANMDTSIDAIKLGATYLLAKPSSFSDILKAFNHIPDPKNSKEKRLSPHNIDHHEIDLIKRALVSNQFNISKTAAQLGMHRRTLQRKLKKIFF